LAFDQIAYCIGPTTGETLRVNVVVIFSSVLGTKTASDVQKIFMKDKCFQQDGSIIAWTVLSGNVTKTDMPLYQTVF